MRDAVAAARAPAVSLDELLAARERRAGRQAALLERHAAPLVCLTIVMPGPVKANAWTERALLEGMARLDRLCTREGWAVLAQEHHLPASGPEAFYAIGADAASVKAATIGLEDAQPIGRLWDFDVIEAGMVILSRQTFGLPPRRCLVCDRPARECGRARRHPLNLLLTAIGTIIDQHDAGAHANDS